MPKKEWTPEERKAFGDKMRAAREKREAEKLQIAPLLEEKEEVEQPKEAQADIIKESSLESVLARALEAIANMNSGQASEAQAQLNSVGKMTGSRIKYALDKELYPSPTERLMKTPQLKRFAFEENYRLEYEVTSSEYTTIDNIRTKEPKFTLDLICKVWDDDGKVKGEYLQKRVIMHEDPDTALLVARQNDIDIEGYEKELDFLNEMRFLQMRDWLLEQFFPKGITNKREKQDMVIDGKLVQYWAINKEEDSSGAKIPFDQLNKSL